MTGLDGFVVEAKTVEREGRRVITELVFKTKAAITAATLKSTPIGWMESVINTPRVLDRVNEGDTVTGTASIAGAGALSVTSATGAMTDSVSATVHPETVRGVGEVFDATVEVRHGRVPKLTRPDGSDPEAFYKRVADAYNAAVARTNKPAVLLAEQADVPVPTVHRWIAESRRRGLLSSPARRGRAG